MLRLLMLPEHAPHAAHSCCAVHTTSKYMLSHAWPWPHAERLSEQTSGMQALRTCPVCRTPSWFVTPSRTWPGTSEEKAATREAYMGKLATIDCKHFAFGDGTCPFGASCFYRHASRDGVPQVLFMLMPRKS